MITFDSQEEFEHAVLQVIIDKLGITVEAKGYPFMTGVLVGLYNTEDLPDSNGRIGKLIYDQDAVA